MILRFKVAVFCTGSMLCLYSCFNSSACYDVDCAGSPNTKGVEFEFADKRDYESGLTSMIINISSDQDSIISQQELEPLFVSPSRISEIYTANLDSAFEHYLLIINDTSFYSLVIKGESQTNPCCSDLIVNYISLDGKEICSGKVSCRNQIILLD